MQHTALTPGYDDIANAVIFEIDRRVRASFVDRYAGKGRPCAFAMSLETARWDDCFKDIERGLIAPDDWQSIVADAVRCNLLTPAGAKALFGRFMTPEPQMEETDDSQQ